MPFTVAFADPPYGDRGVLVGTLTHLGDAALGWLRDDALVAAKHFWRDAPPDAIGELRAVRRRRFGETALSIFARVSGP
jgi:16S rRNA G966 N2-methylase RsmD